MKIIYTFFAIFLFHYAAFSQNIVEENGALAVSGNQIVNQDGAVVSFAGNSLFWSNTGWGGEKYYNENVVNWLVSDWDIPIIRAAMGVDANGGYITHPSNKQKVIDVVDAAINQGIYVIIDWHSHHAEDYEAESIAFFQEMATMYSEYDNVIYEIYNEPLNTTSWANTIKPYSESVITAIRAIDPDNLIIVGSSSWSQDVDIASLNPITGFSNIAYSLHFYAGTHGQSLRNKAQTALDNGIALMVTEWGGVNANGDGAVDESSVDLWMDFLCENNISHCNWALNDKSEGASALKPGSNANGNWTDSDLTPSGVLVKEIIADWNANCAVTSNENNQLPEIKIEIYPNPTHDYLSIHTVQDIEIYSIALFDGLARQVLEVKSPVDKIDIKSLQPGFYFIQITTDRGLFVEQLIIE